MVYRCWLLGVVSASRSSSALQAVQIAGVMSLRDTTLTGSINLPAAFHSRTIMDGFCPSDDMGLGLDLQELFRIIEPGHHHLAIPWIRCHIRDGVVSTTEVLPVSQVSIEYV